MRLADTTSGTASAINRYLLPTEELHLTARQHPAVLAGPIITTVAGLAAAAIVVQGVPSGNGIAVLVWFAWGVLLVRLLLKMMSWSVDFFVVTSVRIMMLTGILNRSIAVIPFSLVNDLSYRRSRAGRLFGYGEFLVRYGARDQVLQRIQYIPYPEHIYLEIQRTFLTGHEAAAEAESET